MKTENEIHDVQAKILRKLLFNPKSRFSDLNATGLSSDHFTFHINKLVESGLIKKEDVVYSLTAKGKEFANRMDTDTTQLEKQAKTAVLIVGLQKINGITRYLVQQRLKEPYFGFHGFISGKVKWGERIGVAAKRELTEEAGYSGGQFKLVGIEHKLDIKDSGVQEDKYFYVVLVSDPKGVFKEKFEGGKNWWLTEEEINKLPKKFGDLADLLTLVKNNKFEGFIEKEYQIKEY